ncbi:hypothetical protein EDD16DRAFT_1691528 [Pisolithus croceorrhizus]|nr:hypothetical protein EDD16DRAFT_1691528 [Pisolithus croceorrhizus]
MSASERGYSVLLSSLHRASAPTPPLSTLQGLIVHYLARLSPAPTPLAATIVGSPLFRPFSLIKLDALKTSFRHAVHTKLHLLKDAPTGLFLPSLNVQLNAWLVAILKGLEGGHAITRLACCSGLLLGHLPSKQRDVESSVQDEIVLAFADVIDLFTSSDSWGKEFRPETEAGEEDALTLSLITCAEALLAVPPEKFVALPLPTLTSLVHTINKSFMSGMFLSSFRSSMEHHPEYKVYPGAPAFQDVHKVSSSPAMSNMGSLSRLCSRSISLFVDHRPKLALPHSGLSAVVYVPPETWSCRTVACSSPVLRGLYHLAFGHNAFPELKRAFYLALDILAEHKAEERALCAAIMRGVVSEESVRVVRHLNSSYLSLAAINHRNLCLAFLLHRIWMNARHRDIFEAAHSVVLAIFSHFHTQVADSMPLHGSEHAVSTATMVPFYMRCLIENSAGRQIEHHSSYALPFAALVKSASASGDHALAWFCIDSLLTACKASSPAFDGDRVHRLHLALVSSVSSLPLALLSRVLSFVDGIIEGIENDDIKCDELLEALVPGDYK